MGSSASCIQTGEQLVPSTIALHTYIHICKFIYEVCAPIYSRLFAIRILISFVDSCLPACEHVNSPTCMPTNEHTTIYIGIICSGCLRCCKPVGHRGPLVWACAEFRSSATWDTACARTQLQPPLLLVSPYYSFSLLLCIVHVCMCRMYVCV